MRKSMLCDVASKTSLLSVRTSFLLSVVFFAAGCPKPSPPAPQAEAVKIVDKSDNPNVVPTDQSNSSTSVSPEESKPNTLGTETPTGVAVELKESLTPAQLEPTPVVEKPVPQPTAEQLARWAQPTYEPLQLLAVRESNKTGFVSCMAHTPDGQHFLLAGSKVTLWSVKGEAPDHVFFEFTDPTKEQFIRDVAVSPDGKWFAAGDTEGMMRLWDIADRKELMAKQLYSDDISQLAISPDGSEIATISWSSEVTVWDAAKLEQKNRFNVDTTGLKTIEYLSPGILVASGETTSSWNTSTGKLVQKLSAGRYNFSLARSDDGKWFVLGVEDALQLWNVAEGKPAGKFPGSFAQNELATFALNNQLLVTANGSSLRVWDVATNRVRQVIDVYGSTIAGLSWLPKADVLLVASENGRTRIWGTPKVGEAVGLSPLHLASELPNASSEIPATSAQLLAAIDLRTIPMLPGGVPEVSNESMFDYTVAATPDEVKLFYRYEFVKNGWSEDDAIAGTPGSVNFRKSGCWLSVSSYDAGDAKTRVSLYHSGNCDLRKLPKLDASAIEPSYESENAVMYRTKADLVQIETTLLRKLHAIGWTAYSRLNSSHREQDDNRDLSLIQNGAMLNVSIGRFPTAPDSYTVQYGVSLTANSIPIPEDSGFVEYDGSTEPLLVATTALSLQQTRQFYDNELIAQGWLKSEFGRSINEKYDWLPYVRGQTDLMVGLESLENGRTRIRIGNDLGNSWQLAVSKPVAQKPILAGSIEAADLPILNESKSAKFDVDNKSIEIQIDATPLLEVADRYAKAFESLGWKPESGGIKADDYVMMTFVNAKAELTLRGRIQSGNAIVNVQGPGLSWVKPLPGGKQLISYETWLRRNQRPAGLDLLDEYVAEMQTIEASK